MCQPFLPLGVPAVDSRYALRYALQLHSLEGQSLAIGSLSFSAGMYLGGNSNHSNPIDGLIIGGKRGGIYFTTKKWNYFHLTDLGSLSDGGVFQAFFFEFFTPENCGRFWEQKYAYFFRWVGSKPPTRYDQEPDKMKILVERYVDLCGVLKQSRNQAIALKKLGILASQQGQNEQSIEYFQQAIECAKAQGDREAEKDCAVRLGIAAGQAKMAEHLSNILQRSVIGPDWRRWFLRGENSGVGRICFSPKGGEV